MGLEVGGRGNGEEEKEEEKEKEKIPLCESIGHRGSLGPLPKKGKPLFFAELKKSSNLRIFDFFPNYNNFEGALNYLKMYI